MQTYIAQCPPCLLFHQSYGNPFAPHSPQIWLFLSHCLSQPFLLAASFFGLGILRLLHWRICLNSRPPVACGYRLPILPSPTASCLMLLWKFCSSGVRSVPPVTLSAPFSRTLFLHAPPMLTLAQIRPALAGLGGYVRLPDDSCGCFQARFSPSDLQALAPWFPASESPQHFIAAWELLAQLGLLWTLISVLPVGHMPIHVVFRTDNSATDSASWKGLSMAKGMCHVLQAFFYLQERHHISVHLDAVPGFLNDTADQLSRFIPPATLGFPSQSVVDIPWQRLLAKPDFCHFPSASPMPRFLAPSG